LRAGPGVAALVCVAALLSTQELRADEVHRDDPTQPGVDVHTFANVAEFRVRDVTLDLTVEFTARRLSGHADLKIARQKPDAHTLVLDTRDLDVRSVSLLDAARSLKRNPACRN
jgi:aminopeptidase N